MVIYYLSDGSGWMWQDRGAVLAISEGERTWHNLGISEPGVMTVTSMWADSQSHGFAVRHGVGRTELLGVLRWVGDVKSGPNVGDVSGEAFELDEAQDVEHLEPDGLDREQVTRDDAPSVDTEELSPGRTGSSWRRAEAVGAKQHPDRGRADSNPELGQFAQDPDPPSPLALSVPDGGGALGSRCP
jgi:hypothetical protein